MKTRLKICIFSAVCVLLAGVFLSQAHAFDDDVTVLPNGKQIVWIAPTPKIDCSEPGIDPGSRIGAVRSAGWDVVQNAQVARDSRVWRRDCLNRYESLQQFFVFWLRQLF